MEPHYKVRLAQDSEGYLPSARPAPSEYANAPTLLGPTANPGANYLSIASPTTSLEPRDGYAAVPHLANKYMPQDEKGIMLRDPLAEVLSMYLEKTNVCNDC